MKKVFFLFALGCQSLLSFGQYNGNRGINMEVFHICATILIMILFMVFILNLLKRFLEHRLRNKIVDKGISENLASSLLQTNNSEDKYVHIKWFAILAGLGLALTIIHYTQPLGIHSLAVMSFCLAGSFLGYYLFTRRSQR